MCHAAARALGRLVGSVSGEGLQAVPACAALLLVRLLQPPNSQTLALAQQEDWAAAQDKALFIAEYPVLQLCNCWPGDRCQGAEAVEAGRAVGATGAVGLTSYRHRSYPSHDTRDPPRRTPA